MILPIKQINTRIAHCAIRGYHQPMIVSFRHKGLEKFFKTGSTAGIQPAHKKKLRMRLAMLNSAQSLDDVDIPGWRLHSLPGKRRGRCAISVSGNWRLTFENDGDKFSILDYEDYH